MGDNPAAVTLVRRIDWMDTDAAGVYHWTTVFRLVEAAEAVLHDRLGVRSHTFGRTPRVQVDCSFRRELRFYDPVEVRLAVAAVGRTSLRYTFTLRRAGEGDTPAGTAVQAASDGEAEDDTAAEGELVVVHVTGQPEGRPSPWPEEVRERLLHGGDQGRVGCTSASPPG